MKTQTNNKTHGRFWSLIKLLPDYNEEYKQEIKEAWVDKYSCGKTTSLSELYAKYPQEYGAMISDLKIATFHTPQARRGYDPESDKWRKRTIAACYSYVTKQGVKQPSMKYISAVICRAANYSVFNKIPVTRLQEVYNMLCQKNAVVSPRCEAKHQDSEIEQLIWQIKTNLNNIKS